MNGLVMFTLAAGLSSACMSRSTSPSAAVPAEPAQVEAVQVNAVPVDAEFTRLLNVEFGRSFIGKRVKTYAAFMGLLLPGLFDGKYENGWVGAYMFAASPAGDGFACDITKMASGFGGLSVVAPTNHGEQWADTTSGVVFAIVGVVVDASQTPTRRVSAKGLTLEVERSNIVGQCAQK